MPLIPLRGMLLFPHNITPLEVGRVRSIAALEHAMARSQEIVLVAQKDAKDADPDASQLYQFGVVARIKQIVSAPDGQMKVVVEGMHRFKIDAFEQSEPYFLVRGTVVRQADVETNEVLALMRMAMRQFANYEKLTKRQNSSLEGLTAGMTPSQVADVIASQLDIALDRRQKLLETVDLVKRLEGICHILAEEIQLIELEKTIESRVRKQMEHSQKEYYLRERLKAIQKELGDRDDRLAEVEELRAKLERAKLPKEVEEKAQSELNRLSKMPPSAAEAVVVRTYLEWLAALPWSKRSTDRKSLAEAEAILEADHYGLEKVKERIAEFIAVRRLKKKPKSPILCLVGPPGVGKTSLAKSLARALDRKFVRFSLGGVRDEAEIRGHRRTYVGSMPGRIIQAMRQAGTKNPLILLDEIDKMASDYRGDPAASLLEVLDPEQNSNFSDHYLEVPFDLSECIFVTTANLLETIPRPLLDRMEVIRIGGYTPEEKFEIARRHLIPEAVADHGLKPDQIAFSDNAIRTLIAEYTREAGVRGLERQLAAICRKAAREILLGKNRVHVTVRTLEKYLGAPPFAKDDAERIHRVGIAHGLAYTEVGGGLLVIEVSVAHGKGQLTLTGKLGEVMRESAQAAFSYIRSRSEELGIDPQFYETKDIHVHVPEGAVPKEGPSAGITIAVALISALTDRPVRWDVGMTGEITLRGRILPVGGIKEKLLAAHRSGLETIVMPVENEKDLEELPANVRRQLDIRCVSHLDEALELVLLPRVDASVDRSVMSADNYLAISDETQDQWVEQDAG